MDRGSNCQVHDVSNFVAGVAGVAGVVADVGVLIHTCLSLFCRRRSEKSRFEKSVFQKRYHHLRRSLSIVIYLEVIEEVV